MTGHLMGTSFVLKCSKIPNKTLNVPNNTNGMNTVYCYLLFSVPKKCPLDCSDGTDKGKYKCHAPLLNVNFSNSFRRT